MQGLAIRDAEQVEAACLRAELHHGVRWRSLHGVSLLKGGDAIPIAAVEGLQPLGQDPAGGRVRKFGLLRVRCGDRE
jgi:hypothetical protein